MRTHAPFKRSDLRELSLELLERADEVVAMREIAAGENHPNVIGLRHDVDNTIEPCVQLAEWEARHGYRATYFVLHDSPYWDDPLLPFMLEEIAEHGHEIAIHANALAVALVTGREPDEILDSALFRLRGWGFRVTGVVAHGDAVCYAADGRLLFVNDEQFSDCARSELGEARRTLRRGAVELTIRPRPLADFGLEYESYRVGRRALYLSDSSGRWSARFEEVCKRFPHAEGQLHILQHPCHWIEAFPSVEVPA